MENDMDYSNQLGLPDTEILREIDYPSDMPVQPTWIGIQYPAYVHDHGKQAELSSVRSFEHKGHKVEIVTTYHIEIDGKAVFIHAAVDNDGRLYCHSTPYEQYNSAVDLLKTLLDRFPDAFSQPQAGEHEHDAGRHEHDSL